MQLLVEWPVAVGNMKICVIRAIREPKLLSMFYSLTDITDSTDMEPCEALQETCCSRQHKICVIRAISEKNLNYQFTKISFPVLTLIAHLFFIDRKQFTIMRPYKIWHALPIHLSILPHNNQCQHSTQWRKQQGHQLQRGFVQPILIPA